MSRERLPNRRPCETINFVHNGALFTGSVGYYPDGRVGEVFLDAFKTGTDVQVANADEAVFVSLAIQHGTPVEVICAAAQRMSVNGGPEEVQRASVKLLEMLRPAPAGVA